MDDLELRKQIQWGDDHEWRLATPAEQRSANRLMVLCLVLAVVGVWAFGSP